MNHPCVCRPLLINNAARARHRRAAARAARPATDMSNSASTSFHLVAHCCFHSLLIQPGRNKQIVALICSPVPFGFLIVVRHGCHCFTGHACDISWPSHDAAVEGCHARIHCVSGVCGAEYRAAFRLTVSPFARHRYNLPPIGCIGIALAWE